MGIFSRYVGAQVLSQLSNSHTQTPLSWIELMPKSLYNRASIVIKYQIFFCREKILWLHFGICERSIFQYLGGEDPTLSVWNLRVQLVVLNKLKSRARSLRSPCVNKWGSDEEQLASSVGLQSTFSPSCCP